MSTNLPNRHCQIPAAYPSKHDCICVRDCANTSMLARPRRDQALIREEMERKLAEARSHGPPPTEVANEATLRLKGAEARPGRATKPRVHWARGWCYVDLGPGSLKWFFGGNAESAISNPPFENNGSYSFDHLSVVVAGPPAPNFIWESFSGALSAEQNTSWTGVSLDVHFLFCIYSHFHV